MAVEVRRLEEEDIDGIVELWAEFAHVRENMTQGKILNEDAEDYFYGYATGLLQRRDMLTLVAQEGEEIVAYMIASKQRKPPIYRHTRTAYLSDAFVRDGHRGKGILRKFITELDGWSKREGLTAIDVMIFQNLQDAQAIYRHLGFEDYRVVLRKLVA